MAVEVEQRVVEVEHEELLALSSGSEPVDLGLGHELFEGRRVAAAPVPLVGQRLVVEIRVEVVDDLGQIIPIFRVDK